MVEQKRTLNIPIYDTAGSSQQGGVDEEAIDVEALETTASTGDRLRSQVTRNTTRVGSAFRNVRANGVKDVLFTQPYDALREAAGSSNPSLHVRQDARNRRGEQVRVRSDFLASQKQSQIERKGLQREAKLDPLAKLKLDTAKAGETYMESLRQSGILSSGHTPASQRKQLQGMHQVYASMMVLQCVRPLQKGLSVESVATVLGTAASMWMLSPDFRTQVGSFAGQMGDVLRGKIAARGTKRDLKAQSKFDKLDTKGRADQLASRWQKRLSKIENAERGHRLPFTAQSAAMTEVALAEAAYADMRRPGADPRMVQDRYQTALASLYQYVDTDGIDREDVSRSMRVIIGQRLAHDPSIGTVFNELGHGRFTRSTPREVYINGTTDRATVWTGDFEDAQNGQTISTGSFSLRATMTVNDHRVQAARTLTAEMTGAKTVEELNDILSEYIVGASVGEYPGGVDRIEDPETRRRLGRARTMFSSMKDDGLSLEDQRFAYSGAYLDAFSVAHRVNPELGMQWSEQFGEKWRENVAESMQAYTDKGAAAESEQRDAQSPEGFENEPFLSHRFTAAADGSVEDEMNPGGGIYDTEHIHNTEDIVDAEIIVELEDHGTSTKKAASRMNLARVNQHYNEVDTGRITGMGRDDAAPLQDVDFELG